MRRPEREWTQEEITEAWEKIKQSIFEPMNNTIGVNHPQTKKERRRKYFKVNSKEVNQKGYK